MTVVLTVSAGPVGRPVTDPPLAPPAPVTPLLFAFPERPAAPVRRRYSFAATSFATGSMMLGDFGDLPMDERVM